MAKLEQQLARLATISPADARQAWERAYKTPAPLLAPALLQMGIAYRLQEKTHGGLPAMARRELQRIAAGDLTPAKAPAPELRAGTQLIREWHGQTILVLIEAEGFLFEGVHYASLSKIAKLVTGAHWSGPRFFGIKPGA